MRYLKFSFLAFVLLFQQVAFAEVFIIYNKATKEVLSISDQDDAVYDETIYEKRVDGGDIKDLDLDASPRDYKVVGKKLVKDINKISEREASAENSREKTLEEQLIDEKAKYIACKQLESEGVIFKHIKCDDYVQSNAIVAPIPNS